MTTKSTEQDVEFQILQSLYPTQNVKNGLFSPTYEECIRLIASGIAKGRELERAEWKESMQVVSVGVNSYGDDLKKRGRDE